MGDPKKHRKKYSTPLHPWVKERIDEENKLAREYGTKNKKELYKIESLLRKLKKEAKKLTAQRTEQAKHEEKELLKKLQNLGILQAGTTLGDVLGLTSQSLMERRLQTILIRKGLARTSKQARQFITHRHILVGSKVITSPSKILSLGEEEKIEFISRSPLSNPSHPEREIKKEEEETEEKKPKKKKKAPKKKIEKKDDKKPKKGE